MTAAPDKKERKKKNVKKSKKRKSASQMPTESQSDGKDDSNPVPQDNRDKGSENKGDETKKIKLETETKDLSKQDAVENVHGDVDDENQKDDKDNAHSGVENMNDTKKSKEKIDKSERKKQRKEERAALKSKKKEMKASLLAKVPKVDKDGISYTKIQIRRMMRRVKVGLPPVATEKEENERRRLMKLEKMEEEEELAGMIYNRDADDGKNVDDDKATDDEGGTDDEKGIDEEEAKDDDGAIDEFGRRQRGGKRAVNNEETIDEEKREISEKSPITPSKPLEGKEPPRKKRRTKPVPADYVCQACKNEYSPPHWIYDCPYKIRMPGNGEVSKKFRGINDPVSRKVFVSGLPFDVKASEVEGYFESKVPGGKVMNCKLFLFDDTKRCKGQGIVTFGTDESAKKALKLNGTELTSESFTEKKKKKGKDGKSREKRTLRLGVTKLLNRTVTKNKRQ